MQSSGGPYTLTKHTFQISRMWVDSQSRLRLLLNTYCLIFAEIQEQKQNDTGKKILHKSQATPQNEKILLC